MFTFRENPRLIRTTPLHSDKIAPSECMSFLDSFGIFNLKLDVF